MTNFFARAFSIAVVLAAVALPASADVITGSGPLGQQWTASSSGSDPYGMGSALGITGNTLSYDFRHPGYASSGVPDQTYVFTTTAANAGALSLDIDVSSFAAWYMAHTDMYIWQGSTDNNQWLTGDTWGGVDHRTVTLDLIQGQQWGFMAIGGNYDGTGILSGSFTVTKSADVPEPASITLLGLGALGLGFARRRKA
jgi:hypothetical protein